MTRASLTSFTSAGKESVCNAGDLGSIPGLGRSPGEGKGYPLQYSDLENSMDCVVHGVANSWTRLGDFHFTSTGDNGNGGPGMVGTCQQRVTAGENNLH